MVRYGMVIDLGRCVGCDACTMACKVENGTPPGIWYAPVLKKEVGRFPNAKRIFIPTLCMHCEEPPCMKACPTGAISKRPDGIVLLDQDKCCGSKACMAACPYGAIHFYEREEGHFPGYTTPFEQAKQSQYQVGTAQKCTFCAHRIKDGLAPACCETCPTYCRVFGDLDDPNSEVVKMMTEAPRRVRVLRPEAGTNPSVFYLL